MRQKQRDYLGRELILTEVSKLQVKTINCTRTPIILLNAGSIFRVFVFQCYFTSCSFVIFKSLNSSFVNFLTNGTVILPLSHLTKIVQTSFVHKKTKLARTVRWLHENLSIKWKQCCPATDRDNFKTLFNNSAINRTLPVSALKVNEKDIQGVCAALWFF